MTENLCIPPDVRLIIRRFTSVDLYFWCASLNRRDYKFGTLSTFVHHVRQITDSRERIISSRILNFLFLVLVVKLISQKPAQNACKQKAHYSQK